MMLRPSPPRPARDARRPLPASGEKLGSASSGSGHLSPRAGRGRIASAIRVRGPLLKGGGYRLKYTGDVAKHVVVPKSQNPITTPCQILITQDVAGTIRMLSAIDLNNQTTLAADKVDCVRTDRLLANELAAIDRARPQPLPKRQFGVSRIAAQSSRARGRFLVGSAQAASPPHPARDARRPLPASGERSSQARAPRMDCPS